MLPLYVKNAHACILLFKDLFVPFFKIIFSLFFEFFLFFEYVNCPLIHIIFF